MPSDLAAVASSPRTLQRRFVAQLGRPPAAEVRRLRIAIAKRLLTEVDRSVKDIAREVGFGTPKRLHEVFHREVGMSPTQYRYQNDD